MMSLQAVVLSSVLPDHCDHCSSCMFLWYKFQASLKTQAPLQVALQLGVERIGPQHQAGSDSLLTSATFMKMLTTHLNGIEEAETYYGVLHQLGEDGDRPCPDRL